MGCLFFFDIELYEQCFLEVNILFIYFYKFIYFIYFWLHWIFVAAHGLSLVAASGDYSLLQCSGFSSRWLLLLQNTGSRHADLVVVAHGLSSCGTRAQ